jgi:hypothetical protein
MALKRLLLVAATAFLSVNLWTGAPLLALWAGSQVGDQGTLTMTAVFVVILVLAALVTTMAVALIRLNNAYDELIGRTRVERRVPWLRSMRAEAEDHVDRQVGVTALELIVMTSVYLAVIAFMIWLVFFAGSSVPPGLRGPA